MGSIRPFFKYPALMQMVVTLHLTTLTILFSIIPLKIVVFTTPNCRKQDCQRKKFQNFSAKMTKPFTLPFTNLTEQKLLPVLLFWPLSIFNDIMWHNEKDKREGPPGLQ